jgi:hypothetical protein
MFFVVGDTKPMAGNPPTTAVEQPLSNETLKELASALNAPLDGSRYPPVGFAPGWVAVPAHKEGGKQVPERQLHTVVADLTSLQIENLSQMIDDYAKKPNGDKFLDSVFGAVDFVLDKKNGRLYLDSPQKAVADYDSGPNVYRSNATLLYHVLTQYNNKDDPRAQMEIEGAYERFMQGQQRGMNDKAVDQSVASIMDGTLVPPPGTPNGIPRSRRVIVL